MQNIERKRSSVPNLVRINILHIPSNFIEEEINKLSLSAMIITMSSKGAINLRTYKNNDNYSFLVHYKNFLPRQKINESFEKNKMCPVNFLSFFLLFYFFFHNSLKI